MAFKRFNNLSKLTFPKSSSIKSFPISSFTPKTLTWSNKAKESLRPPDTFFAIVKRASSVILIFS